MSNSQFCIQQRQQEQQRLKKLLVFGFVSSAALHGILAYALPRWSFEPPNQAKEPMELIIVDKPKPKPKPYAKRYPLGKPKVESKPIVEPKPKPVKPPEPVKAQTPPPPVEPPKPVQTQTPPPKPVPKPAPTPEPKEVLTTPTPAPSQPIVSAPIANTAQPSSLSNNFAAPSSSSVTAPETSSSQGVPGETGSVVAANSAPPRPPESNNEPSEGISCQRNCEPEYPATLEGVEGSAGVKLTIDKDGNVVGAELASADSNNSVNRQALLAARQMQFSSPGDEAASVLVKIDFTVEGSKYDRARREEQERNEQAAKERQEQEAAARQQQLEAEKQAQQEQLEQERQARQQQLEQQQQESPPPPAPQAKPDPKPLPALSPEELDEERLRKFQERIENYQQE